MQIQLHCQRRTRVEPSANVLQVAAMFGLGVDEQRLIDIVPETQFSLKPNQIIFITGASGGGKSTLLQLIATACERNDLPVLRFDELPDLPDRPLVDVFDNLPLHETLRLLSLAGLNDAFVMLRKPSELSDGQRYRLRLAQAMACWEDDDEASDPCTGVILADEFGATLDRLTAKILAANVRKWVDRQPVCFIAATTHDDLLEPFSPDLVIDKGLGDDMEVFEHVTV